jgi:hypothetical protein
MEITVNGKLSIKLEWEGEALALRNAQQSGITSAERRLGEWIERDTDLTWHDNLGESGYGLTDAPGAVSEDGTLYWWPDYAVCDAGEHLARHGKITLIKA